MLLTILTLLLGFVLLIGGANYLVNGSSAIAKKLGISELVIGLTVVAFGTSMPELVVNIIASFEGASQIAIGNVLGSNVSNIFLVLGVTALIYPLTIKKTTVIGEIPFALFTVLLLFVLANDSLLRFKNGNGVGIDRADGLILILVFSVFLYYTFAISRSSNKNTPNFIKRFLSLNGDTAKQLIEDVLNVKKVSYSKSAGLILLGLCGLTLGGKIIVDGAVSISQSLGLSQFAIGVTVVAVGTSLPELVTGVVAALKKKSDIAIGNIVGSNIFNILWILGLTSIINPLPFDLKNNLDIGFNFLATLLLMLGLMLSKKHILGRVWGAVFLVSYVVYITLQFI
ncbi:calcium/sodium antiporter [bacterium]|nr:calcium/sodium antiporter [bacterium]